MSHQTEGTEPVHSNPCRLQGCLVGLLCCMPWVHQCTNASCVSGAPLQLPKASLEECHSRQEECCLKPQGEGTCTTQVQTNLWGFWGTRRSGSPSNGFSVCAFRPITCPNYSGVKLNLAEGQTRDLQYDTSIRPHVTASLDQL